MDPDQIFKRFFGTSFPDFGHRPFRPVTEEEGSSWSGDFHHGSDSFGDLHIRIHQHMEEMDKQMQEAFRIFSIPNHVPSALPSLPGEASDPQSGSNAREQMLKEGDESVHSPPSSEQPSQQPSFGAFFSPWFEGFTGTPGLNKVPHEERRDCDIDGESPNKDDIVDLYSRTRDPFTNFFRGGTSMRVQTIVGADGVVEERRTVKDATGREETTVTRRIGDQSHTVTTITDQTGQEEKQEIFQNIDKDKMSGFDKQWQGKGQHADPLVKNPETAVQVPSTPSGKLLDSRGFFRKFFGF